MIQTFKYFLGAVTLAATALNTSAQIDRSKAPSAAEPRPSEIGNYEQFQLDNGLQVFVVENHKLPRVMWSLSLDLKPMKEGEKAGVSDMIGEILEAGSTNMDKIKLNEEVDFLGARLSMNSRGFFASSLTKHADRLLELTSDVLFNPAFPPEELEKIKIKKASELQTAKNSPDAIASRAGARIRYGEYPYGESMTEASLEAITLDDLKAYHNNYFRPNVAYLIVVGDINKEAARSKVEKFFGAWEKKEVPNQKEIEAPKAPESPLVAVIDKPGAVQSVINIHYPIQLKPGDEDIIPAQVMATLLGGSGFSGRLMKNLREDKAYTYGAYCRLSSDPSVGYFNASASVRNDVTDSAVTEFLLEMQRICNEQVSDEELSLILNQMAGDFARSLERPETVARFALNMALYDLPEDYYDAYLEKLGNVTKEDVQRVAKKYITQQRAIIQVVGNKDEVAPLLAKFSKDGVLFFDTYGLEAKDIEPAPDGITALDVLHTYINKVGGTKKLSKVTSMSQTNDMKIAGAPMQLTMYVAKSGNDKMLMEIKMGEQVFQKQVINGNKGKSSGMMGAKEMTAEELEDMKQQASVLAELNLVNRPDKLNLLGMEIVNGHKCFKIAVTDENGSKSYRFYNAESGMLAKTLSTVTQGEGEEEKTITVSSEIMEYMDVKGLKFPKKTIQAMGPQSFEIIATEIVLNPKLDKSTFVVE